jgi:hypothetical protein
MCSRNMEDISKGDGRQVIVIIWDKVDGATSNGNSGKIMSETLDRKRLNSVVCIEICIIIENMAVSARIIKMWVVRWDGIWENQQVNDHGICMKFSLPDIQWSFVCKNSIDMRFVISGDQCGR